MTRLEGFVVELLITGLSEMTLGSRQEQISSRAAIRSDDTLITFIQDFDNYLTASLLQERSHFSLPFVRLELCRDGHVWTMNARMSSSARCVSNWRDLMIVLEHIVYLYVHIYLGLHD